MSRDVSCTIEDYQVDLGDRGSLMLEIEASGTVERSSDGAGEFMRDFDCLEDSEFTITKATWTDAAGDEQPTLIMGRLVFTFYNGLPLLTPDATPEQFKQVEKYVDEKLSDEI